MRMIDWLLGKTPEAPTAQPDPEPLPQKRSSLDIQRENIVYFERRWSRLAKGWQPYAVMRTALQEGHMHLDYWREAVGRRVPRAWYEWLIALTPDETRRAANASANAITMHLNGEWTISHVRPVDWREREESERRYREALAKATTSSSRWR